MSTTTSATALLARCLTSALRGNRGTQAAIARSCGVSAGTVSGWKHGRNNPRVEQLGGIAHALGVSVADLFKPDFIDKKMHAVTFPDTAAALESTPQTNKKGGRDDSFVESEVDLLGRQLADAQAEVRTLRAALKVITAIAGDPVGHTEKHAPRTRSRR